MTAFFVLKPASYKALALLAPTPGSEVKLSIFFFELTILDFVFEDLADLVDFFSFFKEVSEVDSLLNRIDFSLPRNLEILAIL